MELYLIICHLGIIFDKNRPLIDSILLSTNEFIYIYAYYKEKHLDYFNFAIKF